MATYAIRETYDAASWWRGDRWTPAAAEAKVYETEAEAMADATDLPRTPIVVIHPYDGE